MFIDTPASIRISDTPLIPRRKNLIYGKLIRVDRVTVRVSETVKPVGSGTIDGVEFHVRSLQKAGRLGILPGSFNPPTLAHHELVRAAGFHVDEVLCVLPRAFPHKEYFGATLEQRLEMLERADLCYPYSIASSQSGLFIDIARECREHYGMRTKLYFVCGADAADRILNWDYGRPDVVGEMLSEFELIVAPRSGQQFSAPAGYEDRVHALHLRDDVGHVSSTEVRNRIRLGRAWEHLVPAEIVEKIRAIYS